MPKSKRHRAWEPIDTLEPRIVLDGDHPQLPSPWVPGMGTMVNLDPVTGQGSVNGTISAPMPGNPDDDLFRFTVNNTDFVTILANTAGLASNLNTRINVFNSAGQQIATGLNNGPLTSVAPQLARDGWVGFVAEPGEYYVQVVGENNTTGDYELRVDVTTTDPMAMIPVPPDAEYGEFTIDGSITQLQGETVYFIDVPNAPVFDSIATLVAAADATVLDTRVEIYNSEGELVASDSDTAYLTGSYVGWKVAPGERFYVRIRSDDLLMTQQAMGDYQLRIDLGAYELANPVSEVTRRGSDETHAIVDPFDIDSFHFRTQGNGLTFITVIDFTTEGGFAIHLYDENGVQVAFDDDFVGTTPQIEVDLEGGRDYWVVVQSFEPPPLPIFPPAAYGLYIEAHHTTDETVPVDDHENLPDLNGDPNDIRRAFNRATPIQWNDPRLLTDPDGNPLYDHTWVTDGFGTGRIHNSSDSDLFSFIPPVDMLGRYEGNNDDAGTAVYVGGAFFNADPNSLFVTNSAALAIWDGGDWWYSGPQGTPMQPLGFLDNVNTPNTAGPEIYAIYAFQQENSSGQPILIVGGDFTLQINPFLAVDNLAAYAYNPQAGRYQWLQIGGADGPVRAITEYQADGDGQPNRLIVGGDFTNILLPGDPPTPFPAEHIASFQLRPQLPNINYLDGVLIGGWEALETGVNGPVHALAVYDPEDPGDERAAGMGLPAVADTPDPPTTLFVGGEFTMAGGMPAMNLARWDPDPEAGTWGQVNFGTPVQNGNVNGPVYSLTVWDPPDEDENETVPLLVIGGEFTMAGGVAANNVVSYGRVATNERTPPDPFSDPEMADYRPRLLFEALPAMGGNGTDGAVHAMVTVPHVDQSGENGEDLIIGGAFTMAGGMGADHIAMFDGTAWSQPFAGGFDEAVFALAVITDAQEPGVADDAPILYAGGQFQMSGANEVANVARFNPDLGDWEPLNTGVDGPVFVIAAYDDGNPNTWDRNDRPASKANITVSPDFGAFVNVFINVYNSNFELIYSNDSKSPFPDPAGSIDPADPGAGVEVNGALVIPELWAGETYYIEVRGATPGAFRATGRYNISITVDAVPPDLDGDGVPDDTITVYTEEPDAGDWAGARRIAVDTSEGGDGSNVTGVEGNPDVTQGPPVILPSGSRTRDYFFPRNPADPIFSTPSGFLESVAVDYGSIETIDDTDLFYFRATATGYVEIRVNTTNLQNFGYSRIWDLSTVTADNMQFPGDSDDEPYVMSSRLQSVVRVFDNDNTELISAGFNPAISGENDDTTTATFGDRTYYNRDARVVVPVQANRVYFVQVESGQLPIFNLDPSLVDWRFATGAYELMINSIPDFNPDNSDDVANIVEYASPIPIGIDPNDSATNGRGSVTGTIRDVINNPNEPNNDRDLFFYYATGNGQVSVTATALNASLSLAVTIFNDTLGVVATGLTVPGGAITVNWVAEQGQRFYIQLDGAGGTQGNYRVDVVGVPYVDDHADVGQWIDATGLTINTFLGTATASGRLEAPGDTDLFVFTSDQWEIATVTIETTSPNSLNPYVSVYEIQLDPAGNQFFARISYNDDREPGNPNSHARFSITPGRDYYILVEGQDPNLDFGNYNLTVRVRPTDDHPNRVNFPLATTVNPMLDSSGFAVANVNGNIEIEEDDDVFRYVAPATGVATITVTVTGGTLDPIVYVQDSNGANVPGSPMGDSMTPGVVTISFNVLRSQSYYIVVDVDTGGGTGTYTVNIQTPANDDHANATEFGIASVINISSTTGVGTRTGVINPAVDTDLFRFSSRVTGNATISVTTPDSTLNPRIQVFDANFNIIPGSSDDTESATQVVVASAVNQVFYVLVLSDTVGGGAQTGSYTITVTQTIGGGGPGDPGEDDHANAGSFNNASPITLDQRTGDGSASGIINSVGDTDLFRFTTPALTSGQGLRPVFIQVTTPAGGLVDGTVRVFRENPVNPGQFDLVASDNNGFPGATAALRFDAPGNTTYYILVEPVGSNTGSYLVRVDAEPNIHYLYYPEGYTADTIDEFVPIVNPNNFDVTYTAIARYEVGERDQILIANAVIPANSRGGFTITRRGETSLTRRDTPYAIEIQANGQLGATFAHYDFGVTTGENFTNRVSTVWTFAEVNRDGISNPGNLGNLFNDFVVFYNPNDTDVTVNVTMTYDDGTVITFDRTVGALRRSGINFDTDDAVNRNGRFSVRLTASAPIVAAQSSYDIQNGRGFGLIGDPDGGATAGAIPIISTGNGVESAIALFNSTNTTATVTITASYTQANLPDRVVTISLLPGARRTMTLAEFGLVSGQSAGLRYTSSMPITFSAYEYKNGDGDASNAATSAGTISIFGDAFVTPGGAGNTYIEQLGIYNPANTATTVTIRFLFADGSVSAPIQINVAARRFAHFQIDQAQAILNGPTPAFSIRVDSATPVVTGFTHYDLFLGGGWGTVGAPVGLVNSLATI